MSKRTYPQEVLEAEAELDDTETIAELLVESPKVETLTLDQVLPYAKQLQGFEQAYDFSDEVVECLVANGLAAKTENGLVRGYKYGSYFL